jgi:hypothetical protein
MPLPTALKKWISDCKAYAAKHNCSYKQAMTALKKLKKSRKSHQSGGHSDLNGSPLTETFTVKESVVGTMAADGDSHTAQDKPAVPVPPMKQGGGSADLFGVGAVGQTGGRRRRRRGSKSKRQSQSQSGGKRRKSRRGRRRSSRGGSALSYSQY